MPVPRRRAVKAREEEEDVTPRRRAVRSEKIEEEDEAPRRRTSRRDADDDDEDEAPKKSRRGSSRESDDDGSPKATATSGSGWGKVASKAKQVEDNAKNNVNEFWLADGETAVIQFYEDEPYCTEGHTVQQGKKFLFVPCQLTKQRHCLLCEEAVMHSWKAAFKIFDYRGTWDKDKRRFKHDKLVEKVWLIGPALTEQLKAYVDKKGKTLSKIVLEISRTGAGKKAAYNIEVAWDDEDDRPMKPKPLKTELASLEELYAPPTDEFIADNYL